MSLQVWPFLIGRARNVGQREVAVPRLLAGTPLAGTLGSIVGIGADGTGASRAGEAVLQEIGGPGRRRFYAVFRMSEARGSDFGLGGDDRLLDRNHRPILITEGFLVDGPARDRAAADFTVGDLDAAHEAVVPAYRRFWQEEERYQTVFTDPVRAPGAGAPLRLSRMPGRAGNDGVQASRPRPVLSRLALPRPAPGGCRRRLGAAVLLGVGFIAAGIAIALSSPSGSAQAPGWEVASMGKPPGGSLVTVTAAGPDDAWAGGGTIGGRHPLPLAEHWDGQSWSGSALPAGLTGKITIIRALPSGGAWAFDRDDRAGTETALRWNGRSWEVSARWPAAAHMLAADAVAIGPRDVWVFSTTGQARHYDGRTWRSPVSVPGIRGFVSASAVSGDDVWVFGASGARGVVKTVAARYNGRVWKRVPIPGLAGGAITDVYARTRNNVWAVGSRSTARYNAALLAGHYNGKTWTHRVLPGSPAISSVVTDGKGGLWAASKPGRLLHYAHGRLIPVEISGAGGGRADVSAFAAVPGSSAVWAVGRLTGSGGTRAPTAAIFRYDG